jgi:hypothetical protein
LFDEGSGEELVLRTGTWTHSALDGVNFSFAQDARNKPLTKNRLNILLFILNKLLIMNKLKTFSLVIQIFYLKFEYNPRSID